MSHQFTGTLPTHDKHTSCQFSFLIIQLTQQFNTNETSKRSGNPTRTPDTFARDLTTQNDIPPDTSWIYQNSTKKLFCRFYSVHHTFEFDRYSSFSKLSGTSSTAYSLSTLLFTLIPVAI